MPSTYRHIGEAAPYYDDYVGSKHDDKGYVKVLWKPSRAVQARELTQMQTYSQNQIASLGGYLFKDGTVVQGGIISTTTKQKYFIGTVEYSAGMGLEDAMAGFMANNKISSTADEQIADRGVYLAGVGSIKFQLVGWTTKYDQYGEVSKEVTSTEPETGRTKTRVVVFYNIFGGSFAYINEETGELALNAELGDRQGAGLTFINPVVDSPATLTVDSLINKTIFEREGYNPSIPEIYKTCTCASCTKGTIFVDGYFVNCPMASVMVNPILVKNDAATYLSTIEVASLDSTSDVTGSENEGSSDVLDYSQIEFYIGFWIDRKIVNSYDDETLTDPAGGTYNHKAPGADRYSILAKLRCFSEYDIEEMQRAGDNILLVNSVDDVKNGNGATEGIKFAGGIVMKNNIVIKEQSNIGTNSSLMDELAKRTYEESGNYTVKPWKIQLKEKIINGENGSKKAVPNEYEVSIGPGLGYVYGYRVSTCVSQVLSNSKARTKIPRPNNAKYTEDSLNVLSDDIYTLNDKSSSPTRNVNSWHIERIMSSPRVYLLDRSISEMLKHGDQETGSWSIDHPATSTITLSDVAVLGTCSVIDISATGWYNLKISVLNIQDATNLSNVSCIASFTEPNENGVQTLTGYVDLLHDGEGNTTTWKNVEAPLIFELDWPYVAPDSETSASFVCNAFVESYANASTATDGYVSVPFNPPSSVGIPATPRDINFLVNSTDGSVIPSSKLIVLKGPSSGSFSIKESTSGVLQAETKYWISYLGDGSVTAAAKTSENSSSSRLFKTKTLEIASMTIDSDTIARYVSEYEADSSKDVLVLKRGSTATTTQSVGSVNLTPVTDLVKILSIEMTTGSIGTGGTTTDSTSQELYWPDSKDYSEDLISRLSVFDGCTDFRYEEPTITGLISWFAENSPTSSVSYSVKITYAYWDHSTSSGSFYYAGSYKIGSSAKMASTDQTDVFKTRLAKWYNTNSIGEGDNSDDGYKLIPKYKSATGAWYDLANCIDFRPDAIKGTDSSSTGNSFNDVIPVPSSRIEYTIATYLPRIDCVWVDKNGQFGISQGIPSDAPIAPKEKDGTLVLYNIYNKPYGKTIEDIVPEYIDNRRHTMIDITAIANRLSNLEEVVSLSMSEQSAVNMQIIDNDGNNRYKCGIFTDSFGSFDNCDFSDSEWKATIDTVEKCIRADFELEDWSFSPVGTYIGNGSSYELLEMSGVEDNSNIKFKTRVFGQKNSSLVSQTMLTGGTILTITPVENNVDWESLGLPSKYSWPYAQNASITESTNLQSMMFVTWNGNLVLTPAIDTWTENLGEILTETWNDSERPPDTYRSWTTTTDGTTTKSTVKQTIPSGMTYKDLDKLYGKPWREVPKEQRVTHLPGWWEPATTLTEVATYKTTTTRTVTEKTTYTGSWQANDVSTYMEQQATWMRVRDVKFEIEGMRPNQRLNAAMDKIPLKLLSVDNFNNNIKNYTDFITTDEKGRAIGYFQVPENMPVGTKTVEFYDDEETTAAIADYTANGKTVWTNVDRTYIRTWSAEVSESLGPETTTVGKKISSTMTSTATAIFHNEDPIAESFYVEEPNGITLESIQIYFATKDPSVGVELFIVECENGYPGQTVVPFSRVFVASDDVKITTKDEIGSGILRPTTFKFPVPIQLQGMTEYAFIVIASSYNYEIYTSTLGKADLATGIGVREQPYVGSMFKSQNLKTWTAEPLSDVAFKMFKYQFPVNSECLADFALDDLASQNTGLGTTLPGSGNSGEAAKEEFAANAMTISIGTYIPNATSIDFEWYSGQYDDAKAVPFINKQDIFFDETEGFAMTNTMETPKDYQGSIPQYTNVNSSLKIRACLKTQDPNIAPQIDLEDFHGVFTRNKVDTKNAVEVIDGIPYYDAGTYLSNTIALKDPAIGIKVAVDAMLPNNSLLKAYFKTTGALNSYNTFWTPNLSERDMVLHQDVHNGTQSFESRLLPGFQDYAWKELCNERLYVWYYIYDTGDLQTKFITPNQEAYFGSYIAGYSYSSCMFKNVDNSSEKILPSTSGGADTKAAEIILKDPVNLEIIPSPTVYRVETDNTATGGIKKMYVEYNSADNSSNCIVLGVLAIPSSGPFNPKAFLENSVNVPNYVTENQSDSISQDPNYKGIYCAPYDSEATYNNGDTCLFNGSIWTCCVDDGIRNLSPSDDALCWKRIPCALLVSNLSTETGMESQWMELDVNDYNPSTERENNFMEYNYSLAQALELNEFDSFILKFRMLALNGKDIPRFRNLRAVAVY